MTRTALGVPGTPATATAAAVAMMLMMALAPAPGRTESICRLPDDLALAAPNLPVTRGAVTGPHRLVILTVGGASTAGLAAGGSDYTYPARLARQLTQRLPGVSVTVINHGLPAGSTRARVDRLRADLAQTHPNLVIWAPGTSEAGQAEDPDRFTASLLEGVEQIRAAGSDLILIDLQYAPSIARVINLGLYNNAISGVAASQDIPLLRRSELMRRWAEGGQFDIDKTPPDQRVATIRQLFDCIALGLADGIESAVK